MYSKYTEEEREGEGRVRERGGESVYILYIIFATADNDDFS